MGLAIVCQAARAEALTLSASVDTEQLTLSDQLELTVTIAGASGSIGQPELPALDEWTIYSAGRSQNISIINGQFSSSLSFSYVLVPHSTGTKVIGPVTLRHGGSVHQTEPIQVEVLPAQSSTPSRPGGTPPDAPSPQAVGRELFIKTYVDNLRPYVNQQITLTFAFYQAVDLFENPRYSPPSTTGFWAEDLSPPQRAYEQTIDGVRYRVTEIRTALFPTAPGDHTIGPAKLVATVEQVRDFLRRNPFQMLQDPFSLLRQGEPVELTSEPITVDVRPLPEEGRPAGFQGDVGRYQIEARADRTTVKAGEPATLRIRIFGAGNIKTISELAPPSLSGAKLYDSGSSEEVSKTGDRVRGEKVFEKVIIPLAEGELVIDGIGYSYFDPADSQYHTISTEPIRLTVTPGVTQPAPPPAAALGVTALPAQEPVTVVRRDIRDIRADGSRLADWSPTLHRSPWFGMAHGIFPAAYLGLRGILRRRRRLTEDVGYARRHRARRVARKRLEEARRHLQAGRMEPFHMTVHRAVAGYIGDRLNVQQTGLTTQDVVELISGRSLPEDLVRRIGDCLVSCDQARFAPAGETGARRSTLEAARAMITELAERV